MARFEILHSDLILFSLIIYISMSSLLGLFLVFEKRIMKYLVIYVYFAHLWLHSFSHLLLESFSIVSSTSLFSELANTCLLDKVRQFERYLVYTSFILQISPLLGPVSRDWH